MRQCNVRKGFDVVSGVIPVYQLSQTNENPLYNQCPATAISAAATATTTATIWHNSCTKQVIDLKSSQG
jgi:hypothetical protein